MTFFRHVGTFPCEGPFFSSLFPLWNKPVIAWHRAYCALVCLPPRVLISATFSAFQIPGLLCNGVRLFLFPDRYIQAGVPLHVPFPLGLLGTKFGCRVFQCFVCKNEKLSPCQFPGAFHLPVVAGCPPLLCRVVRRETAKSFSPFPFFFFSALHCKTVLFPNEFVSPRPVTCGY